MLMSSMPVPPPPPPPPVAAPSQLKGALYSGNPRNSNLSHNEKDGASQVNESQLGQTETKEITEEEFLSQVCELALTGLPGPAESRYSQENDEAVTILVVVMPLTKAILQNGPMCGIVALAEALNLQKGPDVEDVDPSEILKVAVEKGYTKRGEMFSITAMQSLAKTCGNCNNSIILHSENETKNKECLNQVVEHILAGCPAMIPYDADFNHSPSLRKGHAAHWAVVHGLATYISTSNRQFFEMANAPFKILKSSPEKLIVKPLQHGNTCEFDVTNCAKLFNYDDVQVIAHQGKSFRTALWKYKDLIGSNQNLKEVAPKIVENKSDYILYDSIVDGLCSKILLLKE